MDLTELASLAEIVGALGIFATLIYLVVELRRNTTATRQQSYHDLVTRRSAWFERLADNPEVTRIFISGMKAEPLNEIDSQRFVTVMINYMSHFQDVYLQHRSGIVESSVWDAERRILAAAKPAEGFNDWWNEASQYFVPEFVEEVARLKAVYPVIYDQEKQKWTRPVADNPWKQGEDLSKGKPGRTPNKTIESDA